MIASVVVGNPKPASRTLQAAKLLTRALSGSEPETAIDVVSLGAGVLTPGDAGVRAAVEAVRASEVVVFASPTYKASFTGLLKCFLDQFPGGGLDGIVCIPMMLGAGPAHALAPEVHLKPVLVELGAVCPTRALYLLDSDSGNERAFEPWLASALPRVRASISE
ncbi:MAG: putative flavoprotein [Acidimicrobiaceae bacterium]|jgi:FMN reductase|nr:putative flavoprotein [Acidimicrobiaceae bacterium]